MEWRAASQWVFMQIVGFILVSPSLEWIVIVEIKKINLVLKEKPESRPHCFKGYTIWLYFVLIFALNYVVDFHISYFL